MPDMPQVPPQIMQALQQQQQAGASSSSIGDMLEQLMQMSPDQVAQVLTQMGIQVTPEQVQTAAENWVDSAAGKASGSEGEEDQATEPTTDAGEMAEGTADDTQGPGGSIGQDDAAEAQAMADESEASDARPTPTGSPRGGAAMAAAGGSRGASAAGGPPGGAMDDLVSAMMMQRAAGNPNAAIPRVGPRQAPGAGSGSSNFRAPRGPAQIPRSPTAAASGDPRMKGLISSIYRQNAAQAAGVNRAGAPAGPRTGGSY
jgi:hypothetical protein